MNRQGRAWKKLGALAAALAALGAGVEGPAARAVGSYQADAGCPGRELFVGVVASYLDPSEHPSVPAPLDVELRRVENEYIGKLITDGSVARQVQASTCEEAALALAYVVALTVSPHAAPGKGPPTPPLSSASSAAPSASSVSPAPSASSAPPAPSASVLAPAVSSAPPVASSAPGAPARPGEGREEGWWLHLNAGLAAGVAPGRAPWARVGYERAAGPVRWGAWLSAATRKVDAAEGSVRLTQVAIDPGVCWLPPWGSVRPGLCGAVRVGALRANASGVAEATRANALVLAPMAQARVEVALGRLVFGALAGLGVPLLRPGFLLIGPTREVFRVPAVTAEGGLTIGTHFL